MMNWKVTLKKKRFLDIFVISNFFFLTIDIFYAHSVNNFAHPGEWIPLYFSLLAFVLLTANLFFPRKVKMAVASAMAVSSVIVGTLGLYFHFEGQFFQDTSFKSLIYTAPLVAPLSYTALGLLLFLNMFVPSQGVHFGQWIVILAYIGFAGNFILSLFDHAQNGFFFLSEWIPVISSALILAFIPLGFIKRYYQLFKSTFFLLLLLQVVVGILGFIFHFYAVLVDDTGSLVDRVLYGPPILAPLLFCDLAFLMAVGWRCILDRNSKYVSLHLSYPGNGEANFPSLSK